MQFLLASLGKITNNLYYCDFKWASLTWFSILRLATFDIDFRFQFVVECSELTRYHS